MLTVKLKHYKGGVIFFVYSVVLVGIAGFLMFSNVFMFMDENIGAAAGRVHISTLNPKINKVDGSILKVDISYKSKWLDYKHNDNLLANIEINYKDIGGDARYKKNAQFGNRRSNRYTHFEKEYLYNRKRKIKYVRLFLHKYKAPLEKYAVEFVHASEYYNIDYRLLPAISIVESSGGKYLFRPNNPFGWGNNGYKSFKDAIWDVARGLSIYYYRLNRRTPELIGEIYNPVTPKQWAGKVRYLMNQMPRY